jgi:hypothetical protein
MNSPAETQRSSVLKERRAMSQPKFNVNVWGIEISAQGAFGITAAVAAGSNRQR